jgi:flavin reductase (DIM6/NTAB) family NADH-FMN oxidoreductase RutF
MSPGQEKKSFGSEPFRSIMRLWASGVAIVTANSGGERCGMTVSSLSSISLDPPLVAVSLARATRTADLVERTGQFGVTILSASQREISERFAGRVAEIADRFVGLSTGETPAGLTIILGGLAWIETRVVRDLSAGTSTIYLGEVTAGWSAEGGNPLLYFDRDYHPLG